MTGVIAGIEVTSSKVMIVMGGDGETRGIVQQGILIGGVTDPPGKWIEELIGHPTGNRPMKMGLKLCLEDVE